MLIKRASIHTESITQALRHTGEIVPGEWKRQVEADSNFIDPGQLNMVRASRAAIGTRNDYQVILPISPGSCALAGNCY